MNLNLVENLPQGGELDSKLEYRLVFPSSYNAKQREGWHLVSEDAGSILGQPLILIARPLS